MPFCSYWLKSLLDLGEQIVASVFYALQLALQSDIASWKLNILLCQLTPCREENDFCNVQRDSEQYVGCTDIAFDGVLTCRVAININKAHVWNRYVRCSLASLSNAFSCSDA